MTTFEVKFEFREKDEVPRTQIRRVWSLRSQWNKLFGQKVVQGDGSVKKERCRYAASSVRNLRPDTMNLFSESVKDLTIVMFINCLSLSHEFLMNNTLTSKKQISVDLIFDLLILAFFGHGELLLCHSELCRLVSGSCSKIHDSSPVMTCFKKKFSSFSMGSRHTSLRFSFCSLMKFLERALHKFSACPAPRSKCRGRFGDYKFNSLPIILTVTRRSDLKRALTLVTFSSSFDVHVFPNEFRLPHTHNHPKKCFMSPKNPCPRHSIHSISPF
jgi:hypothetical protein